MQNQLFSPSHFHLCYSLLFHLLNQVQNQLLNPSSFNFDVSWSFICQAKCRTSSLTNHIFNSAPVKTSNYIGPSAAEPAFQPFSLSSLLFSALSSVEPSAEPAVEPFIFQFWCFLVLHLSSQVQNQFFNQSHLQFCSCQDFQLYWSKCKLKVIYKQGTGVIQCLYSFYI